MTSKAAIEPSDMALAGTVAITPRDCRAFSCRAVCGFDPTFHLTPHLTYQAMRPNDSELFTIIATGAVEDLTNALELGAASLTDRDEEGRSLLNYAMYNKRPDMCKFLVERGADVNAMELNLVGIFGPLSLALSSIDSEDEEHIRRISDDCMKIMMQAGADLSVDYFMEGERYGVFEIAVMIYSIAKLRHVLDFGEPFLSSNITSTDMCGSCLPPLLLLARLCGLYHRLAFHVIDKSILLLNRKANISCRDCGGNTVLHVILSCPRLHEGLSYKKAKASRLRSRWILSRKQPLDLLIVFITAGADVYALNKYGETPSKVAYSKRRIEEWIKALKLCGYDYEEVLVHPSPCTDYCKANHQASKLSFPEYCQQREPSGYDGTDPPDRQGHISSEAEESDDEEESDEEGESDEKEESDEEGNSGDEEEDDNEEKSDREEERPNRDDDVMEGEDEMIKTAPDTTRCDGGDLTTFLDIESNIFDASVEAGETDNIGRNQMDEICLAVDNPFGMEENFMDEFLDLDIYKEC